jgi:hypothetical protein
MGQFDAPAFPLAAVLDALGRKREQEQQDRQIQRQQALQAVNDVGSAATNIVKQRRRIAQAMTLSKDPRVQTMLGGGADRQVANVAGHPVNLPDTNAGVQRISPEFLSGLIEEGTGASDIASSAIAYEKANRPVKQRVLFQDRSGRLVGEKMFQDDPGTPKPMIVRPMGQFGGGGGQPGSLYDRAADNARSRLNEIYPFGPQQAESDEQYNQLLEQMYQEELRRLQTGSPTGATAPSGADAGVIAYLAKVGAKDTPANREWAKQQMRGASGR